MRFYVTLLLFLTIWTMFLLQTRSTNTSAYGGLARHVASQAARSFREAEGALMNPSRHEHEDDEAGRRVDSCQKRSLELHRQCMSLNNYLLQVKGQIVSDAGGYRDTGQSILRHEEGSSIRHAWYRKPGNISQIPDKVAALGRLLLVNIPPYLQKQITPQFPLYQFADYRLDTKAGRADLTKIISQAPPSAAISILSVLQLYVSYADALITSELMRECRSRCDWCYDAVVALAVPLNPMVVPGAKVSAAIYYAAYKRHIPVQVSCDQGRIQNNSSPIVEWTGIAGATGAHTVTGMVSVRNLDTVVRKAWQFSYRSGYPFASIQIDRAAIVYRGWRNRVFIESAPGIDNRKLILSVPGAVVSMVDDSGYVVVPGKDAPKKLNAAIIRITDDGSRDTIGGRILRVQDLPLPEVTLGTEQVGIINETELATIKSMHVMAREETFNIAYRILRYSISILKKDGLEIFGPVQVEEGGPDHLQTAIKDLRPGDRIFFDDIVVAWPDGRPVSIAPTHYLVH